MHILLFLFLLAVDAQTQVFYQGEDGYACIKIPVLLATQAGSLLAWGEGRHDNCSDYAATDLVFKRSTDGGQTWSSLVVLFSNSTSTIKNVIGNAAPVQLRETGRILLPMCRNNLEVWISYSDDDGLTWAPRIQITTATKPDWKWIGTGPPGSIELSSGRIIIPSYHTTLIYGDGEISHSYMLYSDDGGSTWAIGGQLPGEDLSNENQAVDLGNNTILVNARGLLTYRLQSISTDGGMTFGPVNQVKELPESLEGCEGSTIRHPNGMLFFSNPSERSPVRTNLTIHTSTDNGNSWQFYSVVDPGAVAYSSLVVLQTGEVGLLYERSNITQIVFEPQEFLYLVVWSPSQQAPENWIDET